MSGERNFQTRLLTALHRQGCIVQKFTDRFAEGIADTLAQLPVKDMGLLKQFPPGMWMELKSTLEVPKLPGTPWDPKMHPTVEQLRWLREFSGGVFPTMVIFNTPRGWAPVPPQHVTEWLKTPHGDVRLVRPREPITYGLIFKEYARWTS